MKKRIFSLALVVVFLLSVTLFATANPGQNPNQNPGVAEKTISGVTVSVTGGGNNLVILARCNETGASMIIPRAGNGTFAQTFEAFGYEVSIRVQGNSLVNSTATLIYVPYVCEDFCENECGACLNCGECECPTGPRGWHTLVENGNPCMINCYEFDVYYDANGVITWKGNQRVYRAARGYHEVMCVGYDDGNVHYVCVDCSWATGKQQEPGEPIEILCCPELLTEWCEEVVGIVIEPIVVRLGFIGHYVHSGRVMTTSFYWQELNEGDLINWDAVEAAYAGWVAQGGLAPDTSNGWRSSGFAPIFFATGDAIGHGDFADEQLEGFYQSFFVTTGFVLPMTEEEVEYIRYRAYVQLWNDLYLDPNISAANRAILHNNGGLAHYHALLAFYGATSLPPYYAFEDYRYQDNWADRLEVGLLQVYDGCLASYVIAFGDVK